MTTNGPTPPIHALCLGCGGTGTIKKDRLFVSLLTGEASTVVEWGRCPHCREHPGRQGGTGFAPPV